MKKRNLFFLFILISTITTVNGKTTNDNLVGQHSDTTIIDPNGIFINGVRLSDEQVKAIEGLYHTKIKNNFYWYDRFCGAWGIQGGPTLGFIHAGLNIGGTMSENASNGTTNVFINGRQLHQLDVLGLQQLGPVWPGRYWVDAWGNFGFESGMMIGNLWLLARQRIAKGSKGGGGPWAYYTGRTDGGANVVAGDGQGGYFAQFGSDTWSSGQ